jgi:hypothetical protein
MYRFVEHVRPWQSSPSKERSPSDHTAAFQEKRKGQQYWYLQTYNFNSSEEHLLKYKINP